MAGPSLAAVCAVVFSLISSGEGYSSTAKTAASDAVGTIVANAPSLKALDAEVETIFAILEKDEKQAEPLIDRSIKPCVNFVNSLRAVRVD